MVATALTTALLSARSLFAGSTPGAGGSRISGSPPGMEAAGMMPELLRSGLILSLDGIDGGPADFLFTARPSGSPALIIWHPDPLLQRTLDAGQLAGRLLQLASGALSSQEASSRLLNDALKGLGDVRNLELAWRDDNGQPRSWLVSTLRQPPSDSQDVVVTGLVRDVSEARAYIDKMTAGRLLTPGQIARNELLSTSLAASMRQQAHVISSICDLLGEQHTEAAGTAAVQRSDYISDVRATVQDLIDAADLLRDYAQAEYGCLRLESQRWQAGDILAHALPGMKRALERHGIGITHDGSASSISILADLPRLSRLLNLVATAIVPAVTPGGWMDIRCDAAPSGGMVVAFIYQGVRLSEDQLAGACGDGCAVETGSPLRGKTNLADPALSGAFRRHLLKAHAATLEQTNQSSGQWQSVFLHLRDLVT